MKRYSVKITERGQITLPAEVRRILGVAPRGRVEFVVDEGMVRVAAPAFTIQTAYGAAKPLRPIQDIEQVIREAREEHVDEFMRKYLQQ